VDSILDRIKELYRAQLARTGRIPNRLMLTPDDMLELEKFLASHTCDEAQMVVVCGTLVRTVYGMRFRHNPILKTSLAYFEES
jgi:hypothetical protein